MKILIVLIVLFALFKCMSKVDEKTEFVNVCVRGAGPESESACNCAYNKLKKKYPNDSLDIESHSKFDIGAVGMSSKLLDSLNECRGSTPLGSTHKEKFIASCVENAPKSKCECAYDKLEKQYSSAELEKIDSSGQLPDGFLNSVQKSVSECS